MGTKYLYKKETLKLSEISIAESHPARRDSSRKDMEAGRN